MSDDDNRLELLITPKTASFKQVLLILEEGLSGDDLVSGLESGRYSTTLSYSRDYPSFVIDMVTDKPVAEIIRQVAEFEYTLCDDG